MQCRKKPSIVLAIVLLLLAPFVIHAQQASPGETSSPASPVTAAAASRPLAELLPDRLAGLKAASDLKQYSGDNLAELVADKQGVYQEYLVTRAVSRRYAETRVDIFETANAFAAFGLFTYNLGPAGGKAVREEIGSGGVRVDGGLIFWKENYFVRISNADQQPVRAQASAHASLARTVAVEISPDGAHFTLPPLLESLPAGQGITSSERYFLGPESLNAYLERGREMFGFAGDAEAVMAEYQEAGAEKAQHGEAASPDGASAATSPRGESASAGRPSAPQASRPPLKLIIVEYHTPQFAYDAMARVNEYIATLPEDEQNRIIVKREGNYIVEAVNVQDRDVAQALVESVKYPYGVKWLRDPRLPSNDPFRIQKAAQMLLSTFTLIGLLLAVVLVGGGIFGTAIFLRRRKLQQEIFSNAGGMLRLDIDPFEATLLGLPPKRDER